MGDSNWVDQAQDAYRQKGDYDRETEHKAVVNTGKALRKWAELVLGVKGGTEVIKSDPFTRVFLRLPGGYDIYTLRIRHFPGTRAQAAYFYPENEQVFIRRTGQERWYPRPVKTLFEVGAAVTALETPYPPPAQTVDMSEHVRLWFTRITHSETALSEKDSLMLHLIEVAMSYYNGYRGSPLPLREVINHFLEFMMENQT